MSRRLIQIKHHLASGCCMWSGIEDVYVTRTKKPVPEAFLFALSSFGETAYLKLQDKDRPIMFSVADGRTRKTYDRIKDTLGLSYKISEGRTLTYALKSTKDEIDKGNPVILGPLDMYHLPYLKMYHKSHIPMHYILMVGYDEEKHCKLIYDCDREDLIELPEEELIKAWNIEKNAVGDKNGFIRFSLPEKPVASYELAKRCLRAKAERQLCKKPSFVGVNAYYKIANEFPTWRQEYTEEMYKTVLKGLTEFFGMVPKIPNRLMGLDEKEDIRYQGNYDRLGRVLVQLGKENNEDDWIRAGFDLMESGLALEQITNKIIKYLCDQDEESLTEISELFRNIGNQVEHTYQIIKKVSDD